jgi:retinol dehydrogenase-12
VAHNQGCRIPIDQEYRARKNLSTLILACRSVEKGEKAKKSILSETKCDTNIEVWQIDLSDYQSVIAFGQRIQDSLPRLDGVSASAGVEMKSFEPCQGLETSLTVNVVSTFMLGFIVLPKLRETASKYHVDTAISFVGSMIHVFAPESQLTSAEGQHILEALSNPNTADMENRYPLSKLIEHLCFNEFRHVVAKRNQGESNQVIVNLVNPGWCQTELGRYKEKGLGERIMAPLIIRTAEQGSRTLAHGVMAGRETNGQYLSECQVKSQSTWVRSDEGKLIQEKIWKEVVARIERVSPDLVQYDR